MFYSGNQLDILNRIERLEHKVLLLEYQLKGCQNKNRELENKIERDENIIKGVTVKIANNMTNLKL